MDIAINRRDVEAVAALLADDSILCSVPLRDGSGDRPLMRAANIASKEIVRLLLEAGAEPDDADKHGRTALIALCEAPAQTAPSWLTGLAFKNTFEGYDFSRAFVQPEQDEERRIEVAMLLLHWGADPYHVDAKGETAEQVASRTGRHTLANYLGNWTSCVYFYREWSLQQDTDSSNSPFAMLPEGTVLIISQFLLTGSGSALGHSFLQGKG